MRISLWCIYVFLFCVFSGTNSVAQQPFFRNINIGQGLPSSETYKVFQDSKGYIWFCSDGGVGRFNGRSFKCFTMVDGLPDNTVFDVLEDSKGRIWFTCFNGKVCYYENEKFHSIKANKELEILVANGKNSFTSARFDGQDNLWISMYRGIVKIENKGEYSQVEKHVSDVSGVSFEIVILDNNKSIIATTGIKLPNQKYTYHIVGKGWNKTYEFSFRHKPDLVSSNYYSCRMQKDGLMICKIKDIIFLQPNGNHKVKTFDQAIIYTYQDKQDNLWVALSKGGVVMFKGGDLDSPPVRMLDKLSVSCITMDHENGYWFSTLEKGLFYAPSLSVYGYANEPGLKEKIAGIGVVGDKVFVANYKSELYTVDFLNGSAKLPFQTEKVNLSSDKYSFYPYKNKVMICGAFCGEYDPKTKQFESLYDNNNGLMGGRCMIFPDDETIYNLSITEMVILKNKKHIKNIKIPSRGVFFKTDSRKNNFVGTHRGLYTLKDNVFEKLDIKEVNNERITDFADYKGTVLLSTRSKGIFILKGEKTIQLNTQSGLPSNICNALMVDSLGVFWLATNRGISHFKLDNNYRLYDLHNLDITNGLPTNEVMSLQKMGDCVFAGTRDGLCVINTADKFYNTVPPRIVISKAAVNGNELSPEKYMDLAYNQNNLQFNIDCLTFKNTFDPKYMYRLIGLNNHFELFDRDQLEFQGLAPGNYTLEVFGLNNNGVKSTRAVSFSFLIHPPFWRTWWFYTCMGFVLLLSIYILFRWRMRLFRAKELAKNEINKTIAEYQLTALRAQMNPHFIFNAINSIQNFILKEKTQQAYDYLAKFSRLVRQVLNHSSENMITLEQEVEMLHLYAELEQLRYDNAFDFSVKVNSQIDASETMVPGMLLQPFVENAIWHGIMPLQGKRKGNINVEVTSDASRLNIVIEDNGIGREESKKINKSVSHRSMGVLLSDNRMKIIEHLYGGEGASIDFEDLYDTQGKATGTKVILSILYITVS